MASRFVERNQVSVAVFLFVVVFFILHLTKPQLVYLPDGSFRHFGVGYKNKTIFPIWVFAILLGIAIYLAVRYYCL
jgi:hypothetical protein